MAYRAKNAARSVERNDVRSSRCPTGSHAQAVSHASAFARFGAFEKAEAAYTEVEHLRAVLTARIADLRRRNA